MAIGLHLPQVGPTITRDLVIDFAQRAEKLGFSSLWASDHIVVPYELQTRYPGRADGRFPVRPHWPFYEPISLLQFVAGITERIALGTSVLVVPMRNPLLTAKQLASLDVLSGGRLIFGAGAGWMSEEFEAMGAQFSNRGALMDEYLDVILRCWAVGRISYEGQFYTVPDVGFAPMPLQKPRPPLWIGGISQRALRRAARLGDGYHALGPPQLVESLISRVMQYAKECGRDPNEITFSVRADHLDLMDPAQVTSHLREYSDIGIRHVVLAPRMPMLKLNLDWLERLALHVIGSR